ncbi:MAG: GntR family transcriptional regulator [Rhodospirillales bacterium]
MSAAVKGSDPKPDVPPLMLREEAYFALERMIVTGQLPPGKWVSETHLMAVSGHSRASVRSAVQRLQDQDLIRTYPRRGAQISPIDYTLQFRAQELRRSVEGLLARLAAERASADQRRQFQDLAEEFRAISRSLDQVSMIDIDLRNHSLMLAAADNPFAAKAMLSVKGLSRRFWILHFEAHGDVARMATTHGAVATAIGRGDPAAAEQAVHDVIDYVEEFTLKTVGYSGKLA